MSKAEELAEKAYPAWRNGIGDEFNSNSAYYGFIEGYQQAEKDNELTWEDMFTIYHLVNEVLDDYAEGKTKKEVGEEILKRFKDFRERKEK